MRAISKQSVWDLVIILFVLSVVTNVASFYVGRWVERRANEGRDAAFLAFQQEFLEYEKLQKRMTSPAFLKGYEDGLREREAKELQKGY